MYAESFAAATAGIGGPSTEGASALRNTLIQETVAALESTPPDDPDPQTVHVIRRIVERVAKNCGVRLIGFDTYPGIPVEVVEKVAAFIEQTHRDDPTVLPREISVAHLSEGRFAETHTYAGVGGPWSAVVLEARLLRDPDLLERKLAVGVATAWNVGPAGDLRFVIGHELGHAAHFPVQDVATANAADEALRKTFRQQRRVADRDDIDDDQYRSWLANQFSWYSFNADGSLHYKEAYAEAYAAVRYLGGDATPGEQALARVIEDARRKHNRRLSRKPKYPLGVQARMAAGYSELRPEKHALLPAGELVRTLEDWGYDDLAESLREMVADGTAELSEGGSAIARHQWNLPTSPIQLRGITGRSGEWLTVDAEGEPGSRTISCTWGVRRPPGATQWILTSPTAAVDGRLG